MGNLFEELRRRNVFRVAVFYGVAAWLILQVGDLLFDLMGLPDWSLRIVLGILILGLPVVLIFSWVYEMTPEGLKREKDVDRTRSITPVTGRKLDMATIALLVTVAGLVIWQQFTMDPTAASPAPSTADAGPATLPTAAPDTGPADLTLAVLPFRNFSSDAENEYFVDGLSEELMNILAGIEPLRVAARTSSFAFKGKDIKVQEIGRELNVAHVLEGSVRKSGSKIRVTAQLIQVADGYHLWSDNFDRELDDVFAIQDEIAQKVADALRVELLGEIPSVAESGAPDARAYDRYLAGRFHLRQLASGSVQRAAEEFQAAIDIDPDFAPAWAGLAQAIEAMEEFQGLPQEEARKRQREALARAEALNPDLPEVLLARATLELDRGQLFQARDSMEKALAQKPNDSEILIRTAEIAGQLGEMKRHDELVMRALSVDPLSVDIRAHVTEVELGSGNIDAARQRIEQLEAAHPTDPVVQDYALSVAFAAGDWPGALRHMQRLHELRPEDVFAHRWLSLTWRILGHADYANRWLELAEATAPGSRYALMAKDMQFLHERRWDDRKRFWQARLEANPTSNLSAGRLATTLLRQGELEQAERLFEQILERQGYQPEHPAHFGIDFQLRWLAWIYLQQGRTDEAEALIAKVDSLYSKTASQVRLNCISVRNWAEIDAMKGDHEAAIAKLRQAMEMGCYGTNYVEIAVPFDALRGQPAYQEMLAQAESLRAEQRALAEAQGWGVPPGA